MSESKPYPHEHADWKGYTLEELRFQRAVNSARLEIQKERIATQFNELQTSTGIGGSGWIGRIFSSFSYLEYGVLAFRLVSRAISTFKKFKK